MADYEATEKPATAPEKDDDDLHATALKQYERGFQKDRKNQDEAYFDLRFSAEDRAQWDDKAHADRSAQGRPILTVDKTRQFLRQVTGDMRQLRPAIKCVPVDDEASEDVAEKTLPGMIRYIENRSDAQAAYFAAADSQVAAGIGHWRILTEYADADTFNQEIRIAPVEDGVAVVWDSDSILPTREDAMHCFVPVDMSRDAFEKKYPGKNFDALTNAPALFRTWVSDDHVRIAEYWYKKPAKRMLALMPTGGVVDLTDDKDGAKLAECTAAGARIETRDGFKVCRAVISASDIIEEPEDWPGRHIPIVPLLGEEIKIGREIIRRGIVRGLRGPQQLYNYAISTQAEIIALQPKAPFIGTEKMFRDHEDEWETANSTNWPYLEFTPDPDMPGGKPERSQPALASSGLAELLQVSTADMQQVTGIYPSDLGAPSNETSGKAIQARQREGDTGTFNYIEAFGRAVRRTGTIILDLIPHVYDTERMIQIVGDDGKTSAVRINQSAISPQDGMTEITLNDVTTGAYHLIVEMGPSFSTKREEARDGMAQLMQSLGPQAAPLIADLYVKQQDFPLADKISDRLHMLLPPSVLAKEAEDNGEPPPPAPPPPPPPPEMQMKAAELQMKQQQTAADAQQKQGDLQLKAAQLQLEERKLQLDMQRLQMEIENMRLDHEATMAGHQVALAKAQGESANQEREAGERAKPQAPAAAIEVRHGADEIAAPIAQALAPIAQALGAHAQTMGQAVAENSQNSSALANAIAQLAPALHRAGAPRRLIRDEKGRAIGAEPIQ